jgi:hypothetical protein
MVLRVTLAFLLHLHSLAHWVELRTPMRLRPAFNSKRVGKVQTLGANIYPQRSVGQRFIQAALPGEPLHVQTLTTRFPHSAAECAAGAGAPGRNRV